MSILDTNKFKILVEEKERQLEIINKKLEKIKEKKKREQEYKKTEEYMRKQNEERDQYRQKFVFNFFKEFHPQNKEMTEEEYEEYINILESPRTRKGYNLLNFINKDDPEEIIEEKQN